jgi:hypothetical protein
VAAGTSLGRVGVSDNIGPMIARFLSEDNRWINAQPIEVPVVGSINTHSILPWSGCAL